MRFLTKLAVVAGLAVMPLSMAGTAAFASVNTPHVTCTGVSSTTHQPTPTGCTWGTGGSQGGMGGQNNNDHSWKPTDHPTDHPTYDPNGNHGYNNGGGYNPGGHNCYTPLTSFGGDAKHGMQPNDCYPKDPRGCSTDTRSLQPYGGNNCYTPKPEPRCSVNFGSHSGDAITFGRTVRNYCQPQGGNWNYQQGQNNWYDPSNRDWYYPVTGWTGGYQDNTGCWHYPSQHGYTDNSYRPHYGKACHEKYIEFYFSKTQGTWLYEITDVTLHDGQNLVYDGQVWTVQDWTTTGMGAQGLGTYFTLVRNGHTLWGGQEQIGNAHTICTAPRSFV